MSLYDVPIDAWVEALAPHGPPAEVRRALRAVYRGEAPRPGAAPRLARALASALDERAPGAALPTVREAVQAADGTEKLLLALADGRAVEAVLIPQVRREASRAHMRAALAPGAAAPPRRAPRPAGGGAPPAGGRGRGAGCASR
ncbi:MAG: hypothetical protein M9894_18210, partial [Planctomycetes bacterium]|nr:hypothetical protein [Planctomycetota bacterium]